MPIHITNAVLDQEVLRDIEIPPKADFDSKVLKRGSPTMVTGMTVNCPKQADARYGINLPKLPYVQSPAAAQGTMSHEAAENLLKFDTPLPRRVSDRLAENLLKFDTPLPRRVSDRLTSFEKRIQTYKQHPNFNTVGVEQGFYLNEDGPCRKWDHALSADSDLLIHQPELNRILYVDWKDQTTHTASGNAKPAKLDPVQAELTAALAFMSDPHLQTFVAFYEFLQHQQTVVGIFSRSKPTYTVKLPTGKTFEQEYTIHSKIAQMWWRQRNNKFEAKPSGLCKGWCSVKYEGADAHHTCTHWKPKG